ncbi:hypothetical protein ASC84_19665 [Acinetobacter sp. Root1280]|uniref:hypothetical protein n=1 Tax=Acinetobacter sp. Root1280 TaxID=1736444 RepID=UPI0006FAD1D6|nr:hypothetical protein [Acinetobacter sp. Root1280]KQW99721.1 hypothetical protein ASC84_19665 [Acinetobacter sp. Root1280]
MKLNPFVFALGISILLVSLHANASTTWIDNRYGHITSSDKNQYKIGFGHIFENDAGILVSSIYDLGQPLNHFEKSFQEIEGWYHLL